LRKEGWINLCEPDITGGKISTETIDSLKDVEGDKIEISGLRQDTFEYLVNNYGTRIKEISFFKCPRITDLSPLESLANVETVHYYWNQKAERLWDASKNKKLYEVSLLNFLRVADFEPFSKSESLKTLVFGNSASGTTGIQTIESLQEISSLERLEMNPQKIQDNRAEPITKISQLNQLEFNSSLFTTEKVAWLKARLPETVKSDRLRAYVELNEENVLVVGKRKPFLNPKTDAVKIEKYVKKFESLVQHYRSNPELPEPK